MSTAAPRLRELRCEKCGVAFSCGANAETCWCADESFRLPLPTDGSDCLCPECLQKMAAAAAGVPKP